MSKYGFLLVKPEIHAREVKMPDGSTHTLHFKQISAADFRGYQLDEQSDDASVRTAAMQKLVAASLCEDDGKPALTATEYAQLTIEGLNALFPVVLEVGGFNRKADAAKKD
ncbi:hypothetical protein ACFFGH_06640 [Lysobacter korlensis]|uniref:Phage tail assembly chaperone protein, E, or 41 or 14 n=1 Tax=Lysobacter korlensis TaxID=553636 RepID=A0ABV6RKL7_9GAMM